MATISTTEYLDSGTARTAGESMSINGGKLIIRTDTRWHIGAPASMTGTISQFGFSGGGTVEFDGTKVRWIAYTMGAGLVPAIGTTLSKDSVSGYILGFYADLTSAPTAVGVTVPATGFIKLREVTGGIYTAGSTGAGSAAFTLSGPDVAGWIEIVMDAGGAIANSGLNTLYKSRGDWFYLDNTTGVRGQIIQIPTNGGGANTYVPLVQIETAPNSNIFKWWTGITVANGFTLTNLTTDNRARAYQALTSGQIRIGSDGTTNIAALPPAGCRVRIPNLLLRFATTAARASNTTASVSTRPSAVYSGGGQLDLEYVSSEWNFLQSAASVTQIKISNSSLDSIASISANRLPSFLSNVGFIGGSSIINNWVMNLSSITSKLDLLGVCVFSGQQAGDIITATSVKNSLFSDVETVAVKPRTGNINFGINFNLCNNLIITNLQTKGCGTQIISSNNINLDGLDYIDRLGGDTTSSQGMYALRVQGSNNVIATNFTFGENGTLSATHPYAGLVQVQTNLGSVKIRNAGTKTNPLNCGSNATYYPSVVIAGSGTEPQLKAQRLYLANTRNGSVSAVTGVINGLFEHVYGGSTAAEASGINSVYRAIGGTPSFATATGRTGRHWSDYFTSNTTGAVLLSYNAPSAETASLVSIVSSGSTATGFYGDGRVMLSKVGDYIIVEMPDFVIGHTGFQNAAAGGIISANCSSTYQIDTGTGWNGVWKNLNGNNLSSEIVNAAIGFKLKIKTICNTAGSNNGCSNISINTTSTAQAQSDNLYVLDTVSLGFTNLVPGSEVRVYQGTDPATSVEIGGTESVGGTTFSFTHSAGGQAGTIAIFALGYQPIYLPYTFKTTDDSILIQQVVDRNYVNPV